MNLVAAAALKKLLSMSESAWIRGKAEPKIGVPFTEKSLPAYFKVGTQAERQACNAALQLAEQKGAITIRWDPRAGERRQIERVDLLDANSVATLLSVKPLWEELAQARLALCQLEAAFPVIADVLERWRNQLLVRGTKPEDRQVWLDAGAVISHCQNAAGLDVPIRRLSTRLFSDSKRIEVLWPAMDLLLTGDVKALPRTDEEVFGELGLVKFPPTMLMAGDGAVRLADSATSLARPYIGLAPQAIQGFEALDGARLLLSVENLTTFHELSRLVTKGDGRFLIYSAGMPSPSWLRVYGLLLQALPPDAQVLHWGDADTGGFRIASYIARTASVHGRRLALFGMDGLPYGENGPEVSRKPLSDGDVAAIAKICERHGWATEREWIQRWRFAVEQESMLLVVP